MSISTGACSFTDEIVFRSVTRVWTKTHHIGICALQFFEFASWSFCLCFSLRMSLTNSSRFLAWLKQSGTKSCNNVSSFMSASFTQVSKFSRNFGEQALFIVFWFQDYIKTNSVKICFQIWFTWWVGWFFLWRCFFFLPSFIGRWTTFWTRWIWCWWVILLMTFVRMFCLSFLASNPFSVVRDSLFLLSSLNVLPPGIIWPLKDKDFIWWCLLIVIVGSILFFWHVHKIRLTRTELISLILQGSASLLCFQLLLWQVMRSE